MGGLVGWLDRGSLRGLSRILGLPRAYALGYFIPPLRGLVFVLSFAVVRADLKAGSSAAEGSVPPCRVLSRLPRLENRETWGTRLLLIET
jgi:hypothetical protein